MKTHNLFGLLLILLLTFNCSSDDDSSSGDTQTTAQLLRSGTWYLESKTPGDFTDCEKNSSFKFNTNNTVDVDSYDDASGPCESEGVVSATYSLSGNTLNIVIGGETITATINSISETTLNVTDDVGDTIVFDKTQG
ncbi:lipocalin family protein [uncultured Psychroserpens sp.]|uniref:lipocalin family protein n=1 Tax=uncultured Psychroserpens sp. TaxID=255436 RepID=UPI002627F2AA|nr:lipocalin family protein [uncultured Psychroserpens sp.]